jgi:membrane fusion protein (multidrug efflux system)
MKIPVKIVSILAIGLIAVVLIVVKLDFTKAKEQVTSKSQSAAPASSGPPAAFVKAYVVKPMDLENKIISKGTVVANEEVVIASEIQGKITKIHFREGDQVSKDALLVSIEDRELKAQLARSQYEVEFLEKKEVREQQLNERGGVSDEQYQATQRDLNTTKAQIALIRAQLEKTQIRAPFSGTIGLRYVSEGSYLSPGMKIADLVNFTPVKVDFAIPERYMASVKPGNKITFTVDGYTKEFEGRIYAIEPKIEQNTRSVLLRAVSTDLQTGILPGAFASIKIVLDRIPNALCVPTEAIIPEMAEKRIFLVKNGVAQSVPVTTGLRLADRIHVLEGIQEGDTVIYAGIMQLRTGAPIQITELITADMEEI